MNFERRDQPTGEDSIRTLEALVFERRMREMAANMLHLAGGNGDATALVRQVTALADAIQQFRDTMGRFPDRDEVINAIGLVGAASGDPFDQATKQMVLGSLTIAASKIQGHQEAEIDGKMKLFDGIRARERAWKSFCANWAAKLRDGHAAAIQAVGEDTK